MLTVFRTISILEGLSYLAILSVTAGLLSRDYVAILGMGHGVLFMLYVVVSLTVASQQQWSLTRWLPLLIASLVPLAFIPVELYLKQLTDKPQASDPTATDNVAELG